MVNPKPWVLLDGAYMSDALTTDDAGRTVFPSDRPTMIGELSITWGRNDQWTQPSPAVLSFVLWEPATSATWLRKVVNQTAIRRGCIVGYRREGADAGDRYIFQGFTTNVDVIAARRRTAAGMTEGWLVQVQAGDRTSFLGQINWYAGTLPEESMNDRAVRLRNQGAPAGIRQFYFEDRFRAGGVKPVDVTSKSVLDTVNEMYKSFADQWYYEPNRNVINRIPTGSIWGNYDLTMGVSALDGARRVRLYPPSWTETSGKEDPIDQKGYTGAFIGAAAVSGDIALSADTIQDITDIACTWFNKPGGSNYTTNVNVKNSTPPARLVFESWYNDGTYVDPIIDDVKRMCLGDGARPTHPEIRWDTAKTGDIPDWPTFESLTLTAQTIRMVVLAGSPFSVATNYAPVWHPCGGVVRYRAGKWDVSINLAPTSMPLDPNRTPITPNALAGNNFSKGITLADNSTRHFDPSITPFDLFYVSNPNGYYYD